VYAEMVLSGVTGVGEFHYLHHAPDGSSYADPNAMGEALRAAARDAGLRLTLLDTCYLTGGIGQPLTGVQARFSDGNAAGWADRVRLLTEDDNTRVGAALHSVRAVAPEQFPDVAAALPDRPLHIHLSEQPAENEECFAAYGMTPTNLLGKHNLLGPRTTAVHATHLTADDIDRLGSTATTTCFCPTTERDLADGIGPARALADAGSPLSLGSDQHAVIDLMQEAQALEMGERVTTLQRGRFSPSELVHALTWQGHRSIGWPEAGRIAVGAPADLVAVSLSSVRTAGALPGQVVLTASASDITDVVVGGRPVVQSGVHVLGDVAAMIEDVVADVWAAASTGRG
jgi:formiminoglutamate deiminase